MVLAAILSRSFPTVRDLHQFGCARLADSDVDEICRWFGRGWRGEDFPAKRAARLKYGDPNAVDNIGCVPGKKFDQLLRAANTAALETLRQMGMAPSDAEIDAAAAKYHAEREKKRIEQPAINADKSKDDGEKQ